VTLSPSSSIARGGKAVYGAPLGILMLQARFPRIPGDMGNATTWPFPVLYRVVGGASPDRVVLKGAAGLLPDFIAAGRELIGLGAEVITTNCGFLSLFQKEMAAALTVPVATSALMQVPWVQATLPPGKRVGIVTVSAGSLTPAHLEGAGVPLDTPVRGTETGREFFRVLIKAESEDMDVDLARQDVVGAARELVAAHPEVGAIVLECTNMPPYAAAVQEATGLPVYDIYSMIAWFHAGLRPRRFG
jgi:Asp/Glu/hydantoin racemase